MLTTDVTQISHPAQCIFSPTHTEQRFPISPGTNTSAIRQKDQLNQSSTYHAEHLPVITHNALNATSDMIDRLTQQQEPTFFNATQPLKRSVSNCQNAQPNSAPPIHSMKIYLLECVVL